MKAALERFLDYVEGDLNDAREAQIRANEKESVLTNLCTILRQFIQQEKDAGAMIERWCAWQEAQK